MLKQAQHDDRADIVRDLPIHAVLPDLLAALRRGAIVGPRPTLATGAVLFPCDRAQKGLPHIPVPLQMARRRAVDRSRGFFSGTAFAGIALLGYATAATAEMFRLYPPTVYEIEVACGFVNGQRHTVRVQSKREGLMLMGFRVDFHNVQNPSADAISLTPDAMPVPVSVTPQHEPPHWQRQNQFFDIPAGVYYVTITRPFSSQATELTFRNITVPATTGTGGRGSGCRFL